MCTIPNTAIYITGHAPRALWHKRACCPALLVVSLESQNSRSRRQDSSCAARSRNPARKSERLDRKLPRDSVRTTPVSVLTLCYRDCAMLTVTHSVGDLRLRLPQLIDSYSGTVDATMFGNQCIQQTFAMGDPSKLPAELLQDLASYLGRFAIHPDVPQSEDCE